MAYLCSRCEDTDHPDLSKTQVSNIVADVEDDIRLDVFTTVTWCEGCSSNTVHISDGGSVDIRADTEDRR